MCLGEQGDHISHRTNRRGTIQKAGMPGHFLFCNLQLNNIDDDLFDPKHAALTHTLLRYLHIEHQPSVLPYPMLL
jgi:hypothetical protein